MDTRTPQKRIKWKDVALRAQAENEEVRRALNNLVGAIISKKIERLDQEVAEARSVLEQKDDQREHSNR